ncbi:MAG: Lrp/AsnC ligand binding domain-containing protein [Bacteroidales bacterium]|nr:Lrp/AsnC ligand binding domain-containing protein [Bacteroidales bacterium]MBO7479723.1 Lrp/AsnC ligand binding domain-containing protein [Bacteroidales bacterium]
MITHQLDATDRRILSFLIKNARLPFLEIARECGISGAAIHQRVRKMEQMGIITGSRLLVKPQALGLNVCAFMGVSLSRANAYSQVIESLRHIPEIVECHFITGEHALMLKIYCKDNDDLMHVLIDTIQNIDGVERTETWISLEEAIERQVFVNDSTYVKDAAAGKPAAAKKESRKKGSK